MAKQAGEFLDRQGQQSPRIARIVQTSRRTEVRCPVHGHLLGVLNEANQLVIKCGDDEFVVVEVPAAN